MSITEVIANELKALPHDRMAEVLDFIRFLKHQQEDSFVLEVAETSLGEYWNTTEEDEAWKSL